MSDTSRSLQERGRCLRELPRIRVIYADIIVSPRCPTLNEQLLTGVFASIRDINNLTDTEGARVRYSVAAIGAALPTSRTPESFFTSAVYAECIQQVFPEETADKAESELASYLKCTFGGLQDNDEILAHECLMPLDKKLVDLITACSKRPEMISMAKSFARGVPTELFPQLPSLYIDGERYCGRWDVTSISNAVCKKGADAPVVPTSQGSFLWPAPRVQFDISQSCSTDSFVGNGTKSTCLIVGDRGGVFVELVPVFGLVFLTVSALVVGCMVLYRRRMYRRARQQRRRSPAMEVDNERLQAILQFIAQFASVGDATDFIRHQGEVNRQLALLSVKTIPNDTGDPVTCTICLDPVDMFYDIRCGHMFHKECLKTWFDKGKSDCPVCRTKIIGTISPFSSNSQNPQPEDSTAATSASMRHEFPPSSTTEVERT